MLDRGRYVETILLPLPETCSVSKSQPSLLRNVKWHAELHHVECSRNTLGDIAAFVVATSRQLEPLDAHFDIG